MDGLKARINGSLQLRLCLWLAAVIIGVAFIGGLFSFAVSFNEANELQDDLLRQTAAMFDSRHLPPPGRNTKQRKPDSDSAARLVVHVLPASASGADVRAHPSLPFPTGLVAGMHTIDLLGESYRVFVKPLPSGERIAVAQPTAIRDDIAGDSAMRALVPSLALIPALLVVVTHLVRKVFRPVARASAEVDQRGDQQLHPISDQGLPNEIRPFVVAINRLLERAAESMAMQQRFVASAAHELRSPLTALSLQAERLADAPMSEAARNRLADLRCGIERNRALLDQLLTLARAQASTRSASSAVSVNAVFRRVLEDTMPLAEAKDLDLGVDSDADVTLFASEVELTALVTNLVNNAIRYVPAGGRIDLSIRQAGDDILLEVEDNGPGIPDAQRARVLEPFYRLPGENKSGSGLGLSIVKTVAERLGGCVVLGDAIRSASGLRVMVVVPAPAARASVPPPTLGGPTACLQPPAAR